MAIPPKPFLPHRGKGSVECTHRTIDFELTSLPRSLPLGGCVNPYFFPLLSGHHANHRLYTPRPRASPFVAPVRTALQACLPQDPSNFAFGWPSVSLSCEPPFDVADFTPFRHRRLPAAGYLRTCGNVLKQQKKKDRSQRRNTNRIEIFTCASRSVSHNHSHVVYLPPIFYLNYLIQRLFVTIVRRCLLRGHFLLGGVALWRGE